MIFVFPSKGPQKIYLTPNLPIHFQIAPQPTSNTNNISSQPTVLGAILSTTWTMQCPTTRCRLSRKSRTAGCKSHMCDILIRAVLITSTSTFPSFYCRLFFLELGIKIKSLQSLPLQRKASAYFWNFWLWYYSPRFLSF